MEDYLDPEARARIEIDKQLTACGWVVQDYQKINLGAGPGVAVREFVMAPGHGAADYLLFVNKTAAGVIEAKKAGSTLTGVEWQSAKYTNGLPPGISAFMEPLPFAFESTGVETRFTDAFDGEPASRNVFTFYRPETLAEIAREKSTLRCGVQNLPPLDPVGLWPAQAEAIRNLEVSLKHGRPRALIQMATGSGKTFTAANISYRLIKYAGARRVLFLVDRAGLGRQTLKEFQGFGTPDDGRKFTELYNVQHLASNGIDRASRVCISTIQRLYSILKGEPEFSEEADEESGAIYEPSKPVDVAYNPSIPIETFDVIIVDECHRSIYGLWRQVLEYFDASIIGLTATPGKQTLGFFNQNIVMEYNHARAVADNVNVPFDVFRISTEISENGSKIEAGIVTEFRDRGTRQKRLVEIDEEIEYDATALDRKVVAKDQIRTIIATLRDNLPAMFRDRDRDEAGSLKHVPKTLIFAKDDSHADDIVQIVREEFGKGNEFAAKITYKSGSQGQKPDDLIKAFRNSYFPRIAVTVDMIATGTDVKPIECVMFMRMVRSRQFFEQMKGRGVRIIDETDLRATTPDARVKDRFVLVDAVGVTEADLSDTVPMDRNPAIGFDKLLHNLAVGHRDPGQISSIATRIARLNLRLSKPDREELETIAGMPLKQIAETIVDALDPDVHYDTAKAENDGIEPPQELVDAVSARLLDAAVTPLAENPGFREKLVEMRQAYEQVIDATSADTATVAAFSSDAKDRARSTIESFRAFLEEHKTEITALQILYSRPYMQRLTFKEVKELANAIARTPERWTPDSLWNAYEALDESKVRGSGTRVLTDLVEIVRFALGQESELIAYPARVAQRFDAWMAQQRQAGATFSNEQVQWLEHIRDHIAASLAIAPEDFQLAPFSSHGGLGKAYELFGDRLNPMLDELNEALAA